MIGIVLDTTCTAKIIEESNLKTSGGRGIRRAFDRIVTRSLLIGWHVGAEPVAKINGPSATIPLMDSPLPRLRTWQRLRKEIELRSLRTLGKKGFTNSLAPRTLLKHLEVSEFESARASNRVSYTVEAFRWGVAKW